jgi:hypothetical protein
VTEDLANAPGRDDTGAEPAPPLQHRPARAALCGCRGGGATGFPGTQGDPNPQATSPLSQAPQRSKRGRGLFTPRNKVRSAAGYGLAGHVKLLTRGVALSKANVERLIPALVARWPDLDRRNTSAAGNGRAAPTPT